MTRKQDRKEETRRRILAAASRGFRSRGFAGIGVDGIAAAAGVTSGAFYAHFGSKDGAFGVALETGLDEVTEAIRKFQKDAGSEWVQALADYYLGKPHRDDLARGCAMTTLSPEVVRGDTKTHAVYETKMAKIADLVADGLEGGSRDERRARAWAMLGVLIGGLTIARAVKTRRAAEEIASSIRLAAVNAAGAARPASDCDDR
ncbi:MAG: TetR/AcrR family transcriptional regulator [Rhodospirillales bacterium]|nr:TetR/AcrR family transcriptional regulator [Rhodospirillales bacterium]